MTDDSSAPATKGDVNNAVTMLRGEMALMYDEIQKKFYEIDERFDRLESRMDDLEQGMKLHFDAAIEVLRHDFFGANADQIQGLKTRVTRLELHTGIAA